MRSAQALAHRGREAFSRQTTVPVVPAIRSRAISPTGWSGSWISSRKWTKIVAAATTDHQEDFVNRQTNVLPTRVEPTQAAKVIQRALVVSRGTPRRCRPANHRLKAGPYWLKTSV